MPWDSLFPIACLIILIFIVIWIVRSKRAEGFSAATLNRFNLSLLGGNDKDTAVRAAPTTTVTAVSTSYGVQAGAFKCEAGETAITCPDDRKMACCQSPNPYIAIRKANASGPIDLSANMMKPIVEDTKSAAWIADQETRDVYQAYQDAQDEADTADDTSQDPPPQVIPDFTVSLGQFDSDVSELPWDADNATSLQADILWGYVSPQASKSIWHKVYTNNLLSNPGNLNGNDQGKFTYHAPLLDIDIHDPKAAVAAQIGEFLLMNAVFPKIQEKMSIENIYNAIHEPSHKPAAPIKKLEKPVGPQVKSKVGAGAYKRMKKLFANKYTKWFQKKLSAMMAKMATKIIALKASLQAAVVAAGLASAGTAVPYAQSVASMISVVLDGLSTATMLISTLMMPVLEQLIDGEGMCPSGYKSLQTMIPQSAETIIATFIPIIGDIIDMFYMYVCIRKPNEMLIAGLAAFVSLQFPTAIALFIGAAVKDELDKTPFIVLKSRLKDQPYVEDSTLSIYYSDKIDPSLDGNGVGIVPPPLENFQIKKTDGRVVPRDWCNFANPIMMDRMANFYYKYSYANWTIDEDGMASYDYISGFIGVIASSELSCDAVLVMTTVTFDPVTGSNVSTKVNSPVYRRFYFVKTLSDPQGYFTVTGCTNTDDCAPDALTLSTDSYGNYVPSVPKTFDVTEVSHKFDVNKLLADEGSAVVGLGLQMGGGLAGAAVSTLAANEISKGSKLLAGAIVPAPKSEQIDSYIAEAGVAPGSDSKGGKKFLLRTTNDYFNINRGPVIEQAVGYYPEIDFCTGIDGSGVLLTMDQCTDKRAVRAAVDLYEATYTRRVKVVRAIEPRSVNGCYYMFDTVSYNPDTNEEGIEYVPTEVIGYFTILNQTTCVRTLKAIDNYASAEPEYKVPRTIPIPKALQTDGVTVKYPTRRPVTDKSGKVTYVPINPRQPIIIPSKLPKSTTLGDPAKCQSATCDRRVQIDKLIVEFNDAHRDRKIQAVLKAWTSKPNRCDYQVEMLRMSGLSRVVQKETVSINVAPDLSGVPCLFTRVSDGSDRINSGTFIQSNTPALSAVDTSGGILGYKSVVNAIQIFFNNRIKPILQSKPEVQLPAIATSANKSIESLSQLIFNEQTLKACPTRSCRDPDILRAIAQQYNADNLPSEEFFVDKHVMGKIMKAGVADESSCDVIFQDMRYEYDDVLQPPTSQVNTGMIYRFRLTPAGACNSTNPYIVKPGDYFDVSNNAIGVRSASTTVYETPDAKYLPDANIGYTVPQAPPVDCRSKQSLATLKAGLPVGTGTTVNAYKAVQWSYSRSNTICEYKVTKDVTTGFGTAKQKTKLGVETFVTADFGSNPSIREYDLAKIDIDENGNATDATGKSVTLPFLANYDATTPSSLINVKETAF